ncbi:MAG: AraC family transcriptional regulator [Clostridiales bacterium]|nr:AraC family transcriptional regulator [Clostridiales bacterium]
MGMDTANNEKLLREMLEKNFLYSLVFGENFRWEYEKLKNALHLGQYGCVIMMICRGEGRMREKKLMENTKKLAQELVKVFSQEKYQAVVGPYTMGKISIYLDFGDRMPAYEEREKIRVLCHEIVRYRKVERGVKMEVAMGIGGTYPIESAHNSYIEALDSIGYSKNDTPMLYERCIKQQLSRLQYRELKEELLKNVGRGRMEALLVLRQMFKTLENLSPVTRKNKILETIVLATREVQFADYSEADFMDYIACAKEIDSMDWDAMKEKAEQQIRYLVKVVRFSKQMVRSELVTQTIQFMEEHYQEEISLQEVADQLGVTPQHLSKLFKKETGKNYIDWLTHLRIEKAKEILLTGKVSIREVGYLVGIQDPNYFSRLFKKNVGVSPSEYLKGN